MEPTLASLAEKIDAISISVEKTRRYMQWTFIITTVALLLPLVAALFIVPIALSSYGAAAQMLAQ
jgi:hypothetical protein